LNVTYQLEPDLSAGEFLDVLRRSTLAERRPIDDQKRIGRMLEHADIIYTARAEGLLVGVSRAITDYSYCTYLSDLAVDEAWQGQGIGRTLIGLTRDAGGAEAMLVLLAAPKSRSYYPHIGMQAHDSCWIMPRVG
jgi:GNAT superfamily N-acetyltransferase